MVFTPSFLTLFIVSLGLSVSLLKPSAAQASELFELNFSEQADFSKFAESVTGLFAFQPLANTHNHSDNKFEFLLGVQNTELNPSYTSDTSHRVNLYKFQANKKIASNLTFGLQYKTLENNDASSLSGRIQYGFIKNTVYFPNISIGGHLSKVDGIGSFNMQTYGVDLGISKTLLNLTPFANIGWVGAKIDPLLETNLDLENPNLLQWSAGMSVNLSAVDVTFGFSQIGDQNSYLLQAGYQF